MTTPPAWPALPVADWQDSRDTLHLLTQIVGKVRLARTPLVNHWWNVPLYVSARGLTTSLIPPSPRSGDDRGFEIELDLHDHLLEIRTTDGATRTMPLGTMPIAEYHAGIMGLLDDLGLRTPIWTMPVEIEGAVAFDRDDQHVAWDHDRIEAFWLGLVQMERVFTGFRSRFIGKCSPVHLFWGALDLAVTRFSGRPAPLHPGGAPNCGPQVMHEAYSHEVSSAGYWPGGDGEGCFYSYAYPDPPGFRDVPVAPAEARWDEALGEFVLPYEVVRTADDPDAVLLEFLQSTYDAAADTAAWDRPALERRP